MARTTTATIWIGFFKAVAVSMLVLWFSFMGLFFYYNDTRPTVTQPEQGRFYPSFNHGHTAWLTLQEQRRLDVLENLAEGLMVTFLVCWIVEYRRRRKGVAKTNP